MDSKTILITGATGNVGLETICGLKIIGSAHKLVIAAHNLNKAKKVLADYNDLDFRQLDFENPSTFKNALTGIDLVFLLRPPHLSDVQKYFNPFFEALKQQNISQVVFLSVQGAESQSFIPHHKIEKLIKEEAFEHVFLRPGYFMQNLTTTLLYEIKTKNEIYVPSGKLKLNWVDARDVGLVAAHVLNSFEKHRNTAYDVTGSEFKGFQEVANILSTVSGKKIIYESPGIIRFYRARRKQGKSRAMIFVMLMLHFLPRFKKNKPGLTQTVKHITGKEPHTIREFAEREKSKFL